MLTFGIFWRLLSVLRFGTAQPKPISRSKLSTNPVVCRSATPIPPRAQPFRAEAIHRIVSRMPFTLHCQAGLDRGIAVVRLSARLPVGAASQVMAGSNQIVGEPRRFNAALYAGLFPVL